MHVRQREVDRWLASRSFHVAELTESTGTRPHGHYHDGVEMIYVKKGYIVFRTGETRHIVPSGGVVLTLGTLPHATQPLGGNYHRVVLHFLERVDLALPLEDVRRASDRERPVFLQLSRRDEITLTEHLRLLQTLVDRGASPKFGSVILRDILIHLKNRAEERNPTPNALWEAISYLQEHLADEIRVDRFASGVAYSESYLYEIFRPHLRSSPGRLWAQLKIHRACELLATGMRVSQVARAVGYSNARGLQVAFRRYKGMSPMEYATRRSSP